MAEWTKKQFISSEKSWNDSTNETDSEGVTIRPRNTYLLGYKVLADSIFNKGKKNEDKDPLMN